MFSKKLQITTLNSSAVMFSQFHVKYAYVSKLTFETLYHVKKSLIRSGTNYIETM